MAPGVGPVLSITINCVSQAVPNLANVGPGKERLRLYAVVAGYSLPEFGYPSAVESHAAARDRDKAAIVIEPVESRFQMLCAVFVVVG